MPGQAANFTTILANGGPLAASQTDDADDAALDVEWANPHRAAGAHPA